jgi:cytochrome c biogenesis protein CcdA
MGYRLGSALVLMGLLALVVFLVTFTNQQGDVMTLVLGAALSALGLILRRRNAPPIRREAKRFRTLRRLLGAGDDD